MNGRITVQARWIVWRVGGGTPNIKHASREQAVTEARRLAVANPGETFEVFQLTDRLTRQDVLHESVDVAF